MTVASPAEASPAEPSPAIGPLFDPRLAAARDSSRRLADLLRREQQGIGDFLAALAEFDREKLWVRLGHSNLFSYLHHDLGLSNAAAYYRKVAAALIQRFPEVVEPLRDGRLCITSVVELARVMTEANREQVLPRFFDRSKRQARELAAEIRPADVVPQREIVTAMPGASAFRPGETGMTHPEECESAGDGAPGTDGTARATAAGGAANATATNEAAAPTPPIAPPRRSPALAHMTMEPLTAELCRLHVTVSRTLVAKLEMARIGQSHQRPLARAGEIIETAVDLLLEVQAKRRGATSRPQANPRPSGPDHVPVAVRRTVWDRDGGRCQWPLDGGGVCGSTLRLELDHVVPRARGGTSTVDNCRLLCRAHNDLAARIAYGDDWMDHFTDGMSS